MKELELSKSNVDGKYILISTPNELFSLSVEILFSIAIFKHLLWLIFEISFIFILKEKTRAVSKKLTFLIKEFRFCQKYSLHTKMFFSLFFLHISNFKVRDFAIWDCCSDDKNHK